MHHEAESIAARLALNLGAELIETHISWVLLTGESAFKIKKPVRLPFVDYSTLAQRRHFCEEEVRLNQRLAPALYQRVVPITGGARPLIDGVGEPVEYAVRMRRFEPQSLFSTRLAQGLLTTMQVDALAQRLASFHEQAPVAPADSGFATPQTRRAAALACAMATVAAAGNMTSSDKELLQSWLAEQADSLAPLWQQRLTAGRVRECHGDLHLANIIQHGAQVEAFDCIEFDPALRWIDVLDDLAFTVMDFDRYGRADFAFRLLNLWLDITGDHNALPGMRHSVVYRALVRAQVERLQGHEAAAQAYTDTALAWTGAQQPRLAITFGLPGSGKTFASQQHLESARAIRLRSDVERKRLAVLGMLDSSRGRGIDLYTPEAGEQTYQRLFDLARGVLAAGLPVVIDAAFLRRTERDQARALAREAGAAFSIIVCKAPVQLLEQRLRERTGDASEADVAVLHKLQSAVEPLGDDELPG